MVVSMGWPRCPRHGGLWSVLLLLATCLPVHAGEHGDSKFLWIDGVSAETAWFFEQSSAYDSLDGSRSQSTMRKACDERHGRGTYPFVMLIDEIALHTLAGSKPKYIATGELSGYCEMRSTHERYASVPWCDNASPGQPDCAVDAPFSEVIGDE